VKVEPSLLRDVNRTGLRAAERAVRHDMVSPSDLDLEPTSGAASDRRTRIRVRSAREGEPVGTLPPLGGAERPILPLFDLLGARLACERAATRAYEALAAKHEAYGGFADGPAIEELRELREDELVHARMRHALITELGGDPTAITPRADLQLVGTRGVIDVIVDPRTSLLDGLEAIVIVELADHEEWLGLLDLARELAREDLVHTFQTAQLTEELHLSKLRRWIAAGRAAAREQLVRP
jgi:rubrerythrin